MTTLHDVRRAVRVTACDLQPGDTVQPWNDRDAPHRTVACRNGGAYVTIDWTDGTTATVPRWSVYHRSIRLAQP